jgi:thiol-disulfide isomerase/thioredoxin
MKAPSLTVIVAVVLLWQSFGFQPGGQMVGATGNTVDAEEGASGDPGSLASDFSERDIYDRTTIALKDLVGKVVILNFWATWCPPCREEIPALEALQAAHKDTLVVIGVSVFCSTTATELFYVEYKINYPMIYGSYELMGKYGKVSSIPTTFLIGRDGVIAARVVGSRTQGQYEAMLKPLLQ